MSKKIFLALLLSVATAVSSVAVVNAEEVGSATGVGTSDAVLTVAGAKFSATVPTSLPINVSADGVVTTANTTKIINNSIGKIKVTNATFTAESGWTAVAFSKDMKSVNTNTKEVGFKLNGDVTNESGTLSFTPSNFSPMDAKNSSDTDELLLTYDANIPAQTTDITSESIAKIVITLDWE